MPTRTDMEYPDPNFSRSVYMRCYKCGKTDATYDWLNGRFSCVDHKKSILKEPLKLKEGHGV